MSESGTDNMRVAVIVRDDLPAWRVANAAAVASLTLGNDLEAVDGASLRTADGVDLPPITHYMVPILTADRATLDELHTTALATEGLVAIGLADAMLTTNSYQEYATAISTLPAAGLCCFAIALAGPAAPVRRLTRSLKLYQGPAHD